MRKTVLDDRGAQTVVAIQLTHLRFSPCTAIKKMLSWSTMDTLAIGVAQTLAANVATRSNTRSGGMSNTRYRRTARDRAVSGPVLDESFSELMAHPKWLWAYPLGQR